MRKPKISMTKNGAICDYGSGKWKRCCELCWKELRVDESIMCTDTVACNIREDENKRNAGTP